MLLVGCLQADSTGKTYRRLAAEILRLLLNKQMVKVFQCHLKGGLPQMLDNLNLG